MDLSSKVTWCIDPRYSTYLNQYGRVVLLARAWSAEHWLARISLVWMSLQPRSLVLVLVPAISFSDISHFKSSRGDVNFTILAVPWNFDTSKWKILKKFSISENRKPSRRGGYWIRSGSKNLVIFEEGEECLSLSPKALLTFLEYHQIKTTANTASSSPRRLSVFYVLYFKTVITMPPLPSWARTLVVVVVQSIERVA